MKSQANAILSETLKALALEGLRNSSGYLSNLFSSMVNHSRGTPGPQKGKPSRRNRKKGETSGRATLNLGMTVQTVSRPVWVQQAGLPARHPGYDPGDGIRVVGRIHLAQIGYNSTDYGAFSSLPASGASLNDSANIVINPTFMGSPRLGALAIIFTEYAFRHFRVTVVTNTNSDTHPDPVIGLSNDPALYVERTSGGSFNAIAEMPHSVVWNINGNAILEATSNSTDTYYVRPELTSDSSIRDSCQYVISAANQSISASNAADKALVFVDFVLDLYGWEGLSAVMAQPKTKEVLLEINDFDGTSKPVTYGPIWPDEEVNKFRLAANCRRDMPNLIPMEPKTWSEALKDVEQMVECGVALAGNKLSRDELVRYLKTEYPLPGVTSVPFRSSELVRAQEPPDEGALRASDLGAAAAGATRPSRLTTVGQPAVKRT